MTLDMLIGKCVFFQWKSDFQILKIGLLQKCLHCAAVLWIMASETITYIFISRLQCKDVSGEYWEISIIWVNIKWLLCRELVKLHINVISWWLDITHSIPLGKNCQLFAFYKHCSLSVCLEKEFRIIFS